MCISLLTGCIAPNPDIPNRGPDAGTSALPDATVDGGGPAEDAFTRWMKCMRLADWQAANMTQAWTNIVASNNTKCAACHENGGEGFIVTTNEQKYFDIVSKNKFYALEYFTSSTLDETFRVVANELAMTGVSTGQDPHREHPRFNPAAGLAASRDFAQRTQLRYNATGGNCPP